SSRSRAVRFPGARAESVSRPRRFQPGRLVELSGPGGYLSPSRSARPSAVPAAPRRSVFDRLLAVRREKGAGFVVLIDPDKIAEREVPAFAERCAEAGVDAFFIGGSLVHLPDVDRLVGRIKLATDLPVVAFPGSLTQLSPSFDALLYLSVVSGRNPEHLIGQHVHAAPLIRRYGLEAIPTAYLLIESGRLTTAQYMSGCLPIPRHKPEIAAATALAAEM